MRNLFFIEGFKVNHSIFGTSLGKSVKVIGHISDYNLKNFSDYNTQKRGVCVEHIVDIEAKQVKVGFTSIFVTNYHPANEDEEKFYDKVLKEKNLVFETRTLEAHWVGGINYKNVLSAYYISKDDFVIHVGDKTTTYKELKKIGFNNDDKIILSGDNGYSHVWENTTKAENIFNFIDGLFGVAKPFVFENQCRAVSGERYGWKFNDCGELVISVTKEERNFSQVSFS